MIDDKAIHEIVTYIDANYEQAVVLLQRLVQFNTCNPPGNEEKMQDWLSRWMQKKDFKIDRWEVDQNRPNIVGISKATDNGKSLILTGHSDTVVVQKPDNWEYPPFDGKIIEGRVYGRGACDMKGGLTSILMAIESIQKLGFILHGELIFVSVVAEESGGLGTVETIKKGYHADAAILPEPTGLNVNPVEGGCLWLQIEVEGLSTHTGHRWSGIQPGGKGDSVNAIEKGMKIVDSLLELEKRWGIEKRNPLFPPGWTTLSPNMIKTTEWPVMVPDYFAVDAIAYYLPDELGYKVKKEITEHIQSMANTDPWLKKHPPTIKWILEFEPASTDLNHPIVTRLSNSHKIVKGNPPEIRAFESVSDMKFLVNDGKIPTVIYGPGHLCHAHCIDEYVSIQEVIDAAKVIAITILDWCGYERR